VLNTSATQIYPVVVAVPARDERERIADCLRALALQQGRHNHAILLLLNNTTDGTGDIVRALQPSLPCPVVIVEHEFPIGRANAGEARRMAMHLAARMTRPRGVLMTTDADSRVAPDWIEANLAALRDGADVVCGRAVIDPLEAALIPDHLHAEEERVCAYAELLDEIHALLDPDAADPWPRHSEHSGASIAVRKAFYTRTGGVPPLTVGEDRAFLELLRGVDARIRHAPEVSVIVSGRTQGRAAGGMADTIRRRMVMPDDMLDDRLEPALTCVRRAKARAKLRALWNASRAGVDAQHHFQQTAEELALPVETVQRWSKSPYFGTAWSAIESLSPALARIRLRPEQLNQETAAAETILAAGYAANIDTCEPVQNAARTVPDAGV
jgi:hypothetical protein